jgi:hypothetical protein
MKMRIKDEDAECTPLTSNQQRSLSSSRFHPSTLQPAYACRRIHELKLQPMLSG